MTKMNFIVRRPCFPVILDTGNGMVAATSWTTLAWRPAKIPFPAMAHRNVIDGAAGQCSLHPETLLFAPPFARKQWTKAAIVARYNSNMPPDQAAYRATSPGNRSQDKVVNAIMIC